MNQKETLQGKHGPYIILEGISGAGKDTQAIFLEKWLTDYFGKTTLVREPTDFYYLVKKIVSQKYKENLDKDDTQFRQNIILADRYKLMETTVIPAMNKGVCVVSIRSYLSMLVYQCRNNQEREAAFHLNSFVPKPLLAIILDLDEKEAFRRISARSSQQTITHFDKIDLLGEHRSSYLGLADTDLFDFSIRIVDAAGTVEQVQEMLINCVSHFLESQP